MTRGEYGPQDAAADRFLDVLDRLDTPDVVALGAAGGGVVGTDVRDPQVVARAGLRRLETRRDSKVSKTKGKFGGPCRSRTYDQEIKRQFLPKLKRRRSETWS